MPESRGRNVLCYWTEFLFRTATIAFFLCLALVTRVPLGARGFFYEIVREMARIRVFLQTHGWSQLESDNFVVRFRPGEEEDARLVLETAEFFYPAVMREFGYPVKKKIPVVVYSSREELNSCFGWPADENAMGVYWGGSIRVLSPRAWICENDAALRRQVFVKCGPMAHELTHLALDYVTRGNCPRWLSEGLAQYEEFVLTGCVLETPADFEGVRFYSLDDLGRRYDELPDQNLAYYESFTAVRYLIDVYGWNELHKIILGLRMGQTADGAFREGLGRDLAAFEDEWLRWLGVNGV